MTAVDADVVELAKSVGVDLGPIECHGIPSSRSGYCLGNLDPEAAAQLARALALNPRTDPDADWGEAQAQGCRHLPQFQDLTVKAYLSEGQLAHPRGYSYGALFALPSSEFCVEIGYAYG